MEGGITEAKPKCQQGKELREFIKKADKGTKCDCGALWTVESQQITSEVWFSTLKPHSDHEKSVPSGNYNYVVFSQICF